MNISILRFTLEYERRRVFKGVFPQPRDSLHYIEVYTLEKWFNKQAMTPTKSSSV